MLDAFVLQQSDYGQLGRTVHATCATVTTIFLFSRLWARKTQYKGLWWDDYLLIASWALLIPGNGSNAAAPSYGFNLATGTTRGWQLAALSVTLFYLAGALAKTAFAVTLLRITPPRSATRAILVAVSCVVWLFSGACALFTWTRVCEVGSAQASFGGRCVNLKVFLWVHIGNSIFTILSDALLAYLPWRILGKVSIPTGEKVGVGMSMSLVGIAGVLCIVKAILGGHMAKLGEREEDLDWTYGAVVIYCLQQAEVVTYIVAQAIPLLRVVYLGDTSNVGPMSVSEVASTRLADKAKFPATAQEITSEVDIELVQLPTGRIVAADSEEGEAFKAAQQAPKKPAAAQTGLLDAGRGGDVSGDQGLAPAQEVHSGVAVDDKVHRLWADMGLSRRAWSQSPSPPRRNR